LKKLLDDLRSSPPDNPALVFIRVTDIDLTVKGVAVFFYFGFMQQCRDGHAENFTYLIRAQRIFVRIRDESHEWRYIETGCGCRSIIQFPNNFHVPGFKPELFPALSESRILKPGIILASRPTRELYLSLVMQYTVTAFGKQDMIFIIFTENWNKDGGFGQTWIIYL
jgi:hypothetical protein